MTLSSLTSSVQDPMIFNDPPTAIKPFECLKLIIDELKKQLITQSSPSLLHELYTFYSSTEFTIFLEALSQMALDKRYLEVLQEWVRPAACMVHKLNPTFPMTAMYSGITGLVIPKAREIFIRHTQKMIKRFPENEDFAFDYSLRALAESIGRSGLEQKKPGASQQDDDVAKAFTALKQTFYQLPTFRHGGSYNLILRSSIDDSFCVYQAAKKFYTEKIHTILLAEMKKFAITQAEQRLANAKAELETLKAANRPHAVIESHKKTVASCENLLAFSKSAATEKMFTQDLNQMSEMALEKGWKGIQFEQFLGTEFAATPLAKELTEFLLTFDPLETNTKKIGIELAFELCASAREINPLTKNDDGSIDTTNVLYRLKIESIHGKGVTQPNLAVKTTTPLSAQKATFNYMLNKQFYTFFSERSALKRLVQHHDRFGKKTKSLEELIKRLTETTEKDTNLDAFTTAVRELRQQCVTSLNDTIKEDRLHNPLRYLIGNTTLVDTLNGAIAYIDNVLAILEPPRPAAQQGGSANAAQN